MVRLELELPELTAGTAEGSPAPEASSLQERKNKRAEKTESHHFLVYKVGQERDVPFLKFHGIVRPAAIHGGSF